MIDGELGAAQGVQYRNPAAVRNRASQQFSLVEASPPLPAPVQRHGNDEIVAGVNREGTIEEWRKIRGQGTHPGVFQEVDQAAQRAFVETEATGAVETLEAGAAQGADTIGIERITVLERRITGGAEILGFERSGGVQACMADRNAGKTVQRNVADAAFGREKKRKNSVRDRAEAGSGRSR